MNRKELFPELAPERLSGYEANVDVFLNKDQYQHVNLGLIVDKQNKRFALGVGDAFPLVTGKKVSKGQIVQLASMLKEMGIKEVEIESEYARTSLERVTGQTKKKSLSRKMNNDIDSPEM